VEAVDLKRGEWRLVRGLSKDGVVDQFAEIEDLTVQVRRKTGAAVSFTRSSEVRKRVLRRAAGKCEYCGSDGFVTTSGKVYLETHHLVPLSEDGPDSTANVVALCPSHHREAHLGIRRDELRKVLRDKAKMRR
jgi:5-methylcytosine-specific restriction endonuclease McrA